MDGLDLTELIRVSGTPERPKPPHRRVLSDCMSATAASALGKTLLISLRRSDEEKFRDRLRYVCECQCQAKV